MAIIKGVFLASLTCLVVPLIFLNFTLRGKEVIAPKQSTCGHGVETTSFEQNLMFCMGVGALINVPIFKTITHLPPFMGILFGLGIIWLVGNILHRNTHEDKRRHLRLVSALSRIDMASIVFFIGILLAVAVLEHTHILTALAGWLDMAVGRQDVIVTLIGMLSAIVDNVPLVAASMGMYDMATFPQDSFLWEFMAYCAGTGGSMLIIGSAAGVAAMGLEKIHFFWYARKIGALAALGYFAGIVVYIIQYKLMHG
jgi:Na+/H+ antiporter NhaD/arsenite permease-like protein